MGADLLLMAVPRAKLTKERRAKVDEFIAGLSADDQEVNDFAGRLNLDGDDTEEGPDATLELVKEKLRDAIVDYGNLEEGLRDVTTFYLAPDMQHFVTGGMSWGDDPSESWAVFDAVTSFAKLYELLEGWAREDYLKSRTGRSRFQTWCRQYRQEIETALDGDKPLYARLIGVLESAGYVPDEIRDQVEQIAQVVEDENKH